MTTVRTVTPTLQTVNKKEFPHGALARLARSLGVSRSLITRVLKGTSKSQRVSDALEALRTELAQ